MKSDYGKPLWSTTWNWGGCSTLKGSNNTFKDGLAEHYTVCPNKCTLKSSKVLANNRDIHFTWTHCISMITFYITLLPGI